MAQTGSPNSSVTHSESGGGLGGTLPDAEQPSFRVGPATADEQNKIRLPLIPVACWRVDDLRFAFDSSIVLPSIRDEMRILAQLIKEHTKAATGTETTAQVPPISIFAHADPVGTDQYNKFLSGRRAAAIYGLLTRRDEVWEDLYSDTGIYAQPVLGDKWGVKSIQVMLNELNGPVAVDGESGPQTSGAMQQFQKANGLPASGSADQGTRKKLFLAYMDKIAVDSTGTPFTVDKVEGFLARNGDPAGHGDMQGCSEFNPELIFSQADSDEYAQETDHTARDAANAQNRRVLILLFRPGSRVDHNKWPCPRAKEDVGGCIKRFWANGEWRRSTQLPDQPRKYALTKDTFACRFYDRISNASPCDGRSSEALWIAGLPMYGTSGVSFVIHDESGKEVVKTGVDTGEAGPGNNRTFDLSKLDAGTAVNLELQHDTRFLVPVLSLSIGALQDAIAQGSVTAINANLYPPGDPVSASQALKGDDDVTLPPSPPTGVKADS